MKRSSLQWKLTLWFSAALVLMAVLTFIVVFFVSHSVLQKQLRTELIHTVEDNVDEVEFYRSIAQMDQDGDTDHYIRYGVGYLEIDDDFLNQVNGMTTALYHENGSLLYGENPIAAAGMLAFEDGVCRTVRVRGETWYIFDRRLEQNTLRDLWLRGAVPETRADAPLRDIVYVCVWSLLALTLIAIAGGVLIARRALKPLRAMALTAAQISGGDDLKKRMPDGGSDELAQLARAFNGMMQMLIFFLLGLLVFPSRLPSVFLPSLFIALFLTFVARPAAVVCLLTPFKAPFKQQCLISWAGLRGAASIVFAIMAVVSPAYGKETIFHIVFCVVLLSILFQGTLLPMMARKLDMLDERENVLKTFNDYSDETDVQFIRLDLRKDHPWVHRQIQQIESIPGLLIAAVLRGGEAVMPKGDTRLNEGDALILVAKEYTGREGVTLSEQTVEPGSALIGKRLKEIDLKKQSLVVLIQRAGKEMIPDGDSQILEGDTLVMYTRDEIETK